MFFSVFTQWPSFGVLIAKGLILSTTKKNLCHKLELIPSSHEEWHLLQSYMKPQCIFNLLIKQSKLQMHIGVHFFGGSYRPYESSKSLNSHACLLLGWLMMAESKQKCLLTLGNATVLVFPDLLKSPHKLSSMHFIVISFGVCGMHFWKRRFENIANINKPFHYTGMAGEKRQPLSSEIWRGLNIYSKHTACTHFTHLGA